MADIDSLIAGGAANQGANALNFSNLISGIGDAYYKGQDEQAKNRVRNAFKDGVPTKPDGSPDYDAMSKTLYQKGGLDQGNTFGNMDLSRQQLTLGQELSKRMAALENGGTPPLDIPTIPSSSGPAIPNNVPRAPPPQGAPQQPMANRQPGGDAPNGTSIVGVLSAQGVPDDKAGPMIVALSRALGVDPNAPLNPNDPKVRQAFAQVLRGGAPQTPTPAAPEPPGPMQAPQQQPMPQPQQQPQQAPPVNTFQERYNPAPGVPPATDTRSAPPTGLDPEIQKRMAVYRQIMSNSALPEATRKTAQTALEFLQKNAELTPEQRNADQIRRQGGPAGLMDATAEMERRKTFAAKDAEYNVKKYEALNAAGEKANVEIPQLELIQKQMDDPTFYSGFGQKYNLLWKQMVAGAAQAFPALGLDPNAAFSQEAFGKVISGNILNSLGQLKGLGQIRVAEINLAKEASAAGNYSVPANKVLVEISKRLHQRSAAVSDMAQNYQEGRLDAGFDRAVSAYNKANPLFTDAEIADWKKIIGDKSAPKSNPAAPQSTPSTWTGPTGRTYKVIDGKLVP